MGLFEISKKWELEVSNYGSPCVSPCTAREREFFYREEEEVGKAIVNKDSIAFHWLSCCQERKWNLSSSSSWVLLPLQDMRAPLSGLLTPFN